MPHGYFPISISHSIMGALRCLHHASCLVEAALPSRAKVSDLRKIVGRQKEGKIARGFMTKMRD